MFIDGQFSTPILRPTQAKPGLTKTPARTNPRRTVPPMIHTVPSSTRRSSSALLLSLTAAAALVCAPAQAGEAAVTDEILVSAKSHMSEQAVQALFAVHGAQEVDSLPELNVRVLRVPAEKRDKVLAALQHNPNIEFAELNAIASPGALTNDPYVTNAAEWHLAKIQAGQAWNISVGTVNTVVAVVDSG